MSPALLPALPPALLSAVLPLVGPLKEPTLHVNVVASEFRLWRDGVPLGDDEDEDEDEGGSQMT